MWKTVGLISGFLLLGLIVVGIWVVATEVPKEMDHHVQVDISGIEEGPLLMRVTYLTRKGHWFYEPPFASSETARKFSFQNRLRTRYFPVDAKDGFRLKGKCVWYSLTLYAGTKQYSLGFQEVGVFSRVRQKWVVSAGDYVAPAFYRRSLKKEVRQLEIELRLRQEFEGEVVTVVAFPEEEKKVLGKEHYLEYLKGLSSQYDFIYVGVRADNNQPELVDRVPYEVRYHDTGEVFLRFVTQVDSFADDKPGYVRIYVPKGHQYDIEFYPGRRSWPGLGPQQYVKPKPLKPNLVEGLNPSHEPDGSQSEIVLRRSPDYHPGWQWED